MKELILKYKHYFILILALLIVEKVTMPLHESILQEQQRLALTQKRVMKTEVVIAQSERLEMDQVKIMMAKQKSRSLFFSANYEAQFKIIAQEKIESVLQQSGCEFSAITWKGSQPLSDELIEWRIEVRYEANPSCLITATRNLEAAKPLLRINDYVYGGKKINSRPNERLRGTLQLKLWQAKESI